MLYHFLRALQIPSVFTYFSTRIFFAALTAFLITTLFGPSFIKWATRRKNDQAHNDGRSAILDELHKGKRLTPIWGGALILSSMLISLFLWLDLTNAFSFILLFSMLFFGAVGAIDDHLKEKNKNAKGLTSYQKLSFQLFFVCLLGLYLYIPGMAERFFLKASTAQLDGNHFSLQQFQTLYFAPFFKHPLIAVSAIALPASFVFAFCVIAGTSNGVNLTDGLDGLATGCLILTSSVFLLIAFLSNNIVFAEYLHIPYIEGSGEIAIFLGAQLGALLGFLIYNGYPAQIFMGDMGSLSLGALTGVCALLLKKELLLLIAGGIFVAESLSVIIQVASFRFVKKRVFRCAPFHHHFRFGGMPESKVVLRFWIAALILALIAIATLKFQ